MKNKIKFKIKKTDIGCYTISSNRKVKIEDLPIEAVISDKNGKETILILK